MKLSRLLQLRDCLVILTITTVYVCLTTTITYAPSYNWLIPILDEFVIVRFTTVIIDKFYKEPVIADLNTSSIRNCSAE